MPLARRLLPPSWTATLLLGLACAPAVEPPPPPPDPVFAQVRVLGLVGAEASLDTVVQVPTVLPVSYGSVGSPGASSFREVQVGEATAIALASQASVGSATQALEKDALYSIVQSGPSTGPRAVKWLKETFPPAAPGTAQLRFVRATDQGAGADVTLGEQLIALAPERDDLGLWRELQVPAEPVPLTVATRDLLTARFSTFTLAAGDLLTLVLVDGRLDSPPRLAVIRESRDPSVAATVDPLLEPDGVTKPKAFVRLLNAAFAAGTVSAVARDQTTGPLVVAESLEAARVGAWTEVTTDAAFTVTSGEDELLATTLALTEGASHTLVFTPGPTAGTFLLLDWTTERTATGHRARFGHALAGIPGTMEFLVESDLSSLFPAIASGSAGAYVEVPADPVDALVKANFGPNPLPPIARLRALSFPVDTPVTVALVGRIDIQVPENSTAVALVLDDAASTVLQSVIPEPLQGSPPPNP